MTRCEAAQRARDIWGPGVRVTPWLHPTADYWWVEVHGDAHVHALDSFGHVACTHAGCHLSEAKAVLG